MRGGAFFPSNSSPRIILAVSPLPGSNVIMTPHCSPRTDGTIERRSRDVARNIDRFVRGEPLENVVAKT
jgi:phosphoglycerate dehydrogenase-like enzyme